MTKLDIMNNATRAFHKAKFVLKKRSPEILIVAGVVGTVTSAVMACKATTKIDGILEKHKEQVDAIHNAIENPETINNAEYTVEDSKKDLTIVYAHTAIDFVKLYAPAVGLGVLSITAILTSNNILRKRNAAIVAAYTALDKSFKDYRGRVIERFGKELDRELRFDIKDKEIEETVVNEDGTEAVVTKNVRVVDGHHLSDYAIFFDETCKGYEKDPELNRMIINRVQDWANDKLRRQGYLFWNEVRVELGLDRTRSGQCVGWVLDGEGDGYVDLGLFTAHVNNRFVNGYEPVAILDPNVDGEILKRLP